MLKGRKVLLRPLKKDDYKYTLAWRNDVELSGLLMSHPFPITEELELEWYNQILLDKSNKTIYFGIDDINGNFVGIVFISEINWLHRTCRFHILIGDTKDRGIGYGADAIEVIKSFIFNSLNLRKITLEVLESNYKAIKLYKSAGFEIEGKLERQYYFNGKYNSVVIMSMFESIQ